MSYIVSQLITAENIYKFSLLGQSEDRKIAARIAATAYFKYNRTASEQNVAMITEWLTTRNEYSFRLDKHHRLQLAITSLPIAKDDTNVATADTGETDKVVFTVSESEDAELLRLSKALFDGRGSAVRDTTACPISKS